VSEAGPLPGTSYSLVKLLGSGGSGQVYLGIHEPLGKQVAIKLLRRDRDAESQDRLRAEARLLARISHPALVGVYDLGQTSDGRTFLVMEYVEGETLSEKLRRQGALPHAVACELCAQILDGLAVAHAHGVVHRDIKGSNIIVGSDGRARIVDFGVAKAVVGRLPSLDLYATGCLLFELLSGAPPSPDTSPVTLQHEANPELEAFLAQVLAKDPAERPASASSSIAPASCGRTIRRATTTTSPSSSRRSMGYRSRSSLRQHAWR